MIPRRTTITTMAIPARREVSSLGRSISTLKPPEVSIFAAVLLGAYNSLVAIILEMAVKVVIKHRSLQGNNSMLQLVATVYINGGEYRVMAPSQVTGDALDWL